MKKLARVLALVLVAATVCLALASCSKTLSGTYTSDATIAGTGVKTSYVFKGSKVTLTVTTMLLGNVTSTDEFEGTYKIEKADDGSMTIAFDFDKETDEYGGKQTFVEDKDAGTIKIGILTYTKQ